MIVLSIDATTGQVIPSGSTDLSKCLVCNTDVSLPVPKCGMDSAKLAAMQLTAKMLTEDIANIEASKCCGGNGKVTEIWSTIAVTDIGLSG